MDKKLLVVANWKANKNFEETKKWLSDYRLLTTKEIPGSIEVAVAAPYPSLGLLSGDQFALAAQDVSVFPPGAYTGEVPAVLLKNIGVKYALIGHSERRRYFSETNREVEAKLKQAIDNGIIPIICAQTMEEIPPNVRNYRSPQYLVMYEPTEAISSEGIYHPEKVEKIQATLSDWQKKLPSGVKFLYGGSVNEENARSIAEVLVVSGFVVGHASLDPNEFHKIIKQLVLV